MLVTVAERLRTCLRAGDHVARFGGDEFVVLLDTLHQRDDVLAVVQAVLRVVEVPVEAHGRSLSVTPSIGIALYPEHGDNADALAFSGPYHGTQRRVWVCSRRWLETDLERLVAVGRHPTRLLPEYELLPETADATMTATTVGGTLFRPGRPPEPVA